MPACSLADGTGGGAKRGLVSGDLLAFPLAGGLDGLDVVFAAGAGSFLGEALFAVLAAAFGADLGDFFETDLVATIFFFNLLAIWM